VLLNSLLARHRDLLLIDAIRGCQVGIHLTTATKSGAALLLVLPSPFRTITALRH